MKYVLVDDRAAIRLKGDDVSGFLQALVTADISALASYHASYAALLAPQGKILFDFFVFNAGAEGFFLDCARSLCTDLIKRLSLYRLRRKIDIVLDEDYKIAISINGLEGNSALESQLVYRDPRTALMGWRAFVKGAIHCDDEAEYLYHYNKLRLELGLACSLRDLSLHGFFPHEANLDRLGAVSFSKGCYIGQEVVSRMHHHQSGIRRRIVPVFFPDQAPLPTTPILVNDRSVGMVLSSQDKNALAVLRLDRLEKGHHPRAAGKILELLRPPYDGPVHESVVD